MLKRHKDLLRTIVASLRLTLAGAGAVDGSGQRGDLDRELERLGVSPDGALTPLDVLPNVSVQERRARAAAEEYLHAAVAKAGVKKAGEGAAGEARRLAREELVERAAYSWINRLLALRAMEARGLIDETLRSNSDYDGLSEALFVLRQSEPARTSGADGGWWAVIEDACVAQAAYLPGLFDLADPAVALRPSTPALIRCVQVIGAAPGGFTRNEADAAFADPDAVGWAYQFYQEAAKANVYTKLGSGGKAATRAEIAAATQLFTEPYMVQWLLQNSLGRSYHEAYPDSKLPATWAYYIRNRPEGQTAPEHPRPLEALDLIDPCCGSGHFLREAFDMFAAMYRERHPGLAAAEIADRVLARHLHGIDLDPRAAQLAALTLYLRAWELVRDERRAKRLPGPGSYAPPTENNIASTPSGLSAGALQRHLRRHPEDRVLKPLLEGVFTALEQADILGSLLRPAEHIDAAIKALQGTHQVAMDFEADDAALRRTITELARRDPAELKKVLLDRVAKSFAAEAGAGDVAADLFGREAERGVRLLQLLDRKYAVVVTNPPYMGSSSMVEALRKYVENNYSLGKRDLYAAFILKCHGLTKEYGFSALITLQSYLSNSSYEDLRVFVIKNVTIEAIISLGRHAFGEIDPAGNPVLLTFRQSKPSLSSQFVGYRIKAPLASEIQADLVRQSTSNRTATPLNTVRQSAFMQIQTQVLCFWLPDHVLNVLANSSKIGDIADVRAGLTTSDALRFYRFYWEIASVGRRHWYPIANSGGYKRWLGLNRDRMRWDVGTQQILSTIGNKLPSREYYGLIGVELTQGTSGSLCARAFSGSAFSNSSIAVFPRHADNNSLLWLLNSRTLSYYLRAICHKKFGFEAGHVRALPIPSKLKNYTNAVHSTLLLKGKVISTDLTDAMFDAVCGLREGFLIGLFVCSLESYLEQLLLLSLQIDTYKSVIFSETGVPAGFHPLLNGYDALPELPADLDLPALPQEVLDYLAAHQRIAPSPAELRRLKERLRALYEAGPGAKEDDAGEAEAAGGEDEEDEGAASGAHIPIPTETFLEELSVKMQLHPISVYWLLEELRREGARCKPEERRLLEDRLSVLVLRLLGHRWPKQIEAGEPVPTWADRDGIIALARGADGLAERVRARLREEDGDVGANRAEGLLAELTGLNLEEWLRREFFKRHVRQFKYRPIAWHLASDPAAAAGGGKGKGRGGKRQPSFECLLYYHATAGDALARVRTQYVEPLLRIERQNLETARRTRDETQAAQAQARIQELEEFTRRLREVEELGFASPELDKALANEPLDRWSGDGLLAPAEHVDLLRQERAWRVDLNDGVRVNIAPLQLAGLLAGDVLKGADAKKALADRSRWRSDERRWVREGKLPRCSWMPEGVPESEAWTKLAPQREAERRKLAEKRKAALGAPENIPT